MIKVGLIGCGSWGRNYIRNFEHLDDAEMRACCDTSETNVNQAKRLLSTIQACDSPKSLIEDPELDAVVLATPARTHFELAKSALCAGKHVLVEKPLANTVEQAHELIDMAEAKKRVLMVGHILEYHPAALKLKEIVRDGELGKIQYLYLTRTNLGRFRSDVNVMWDLGPHDVSIVHFLLDKVPARVSARGKSYVLEGVEDVVFLLLEFEEDVVASIHISWLDPCKLRRVTVIGDRKMAVFDDLESVDKIRVYDKGISYNPTTEREFEDFGSFQLAYRYGDIVIPQVELSEPLRNQCTHFIDCIRNGGRPRTDGANGLRVVRVLEAAQKSLESDGRFIEISSIPD